MIFREWRCDLFSLDHVTLNFLSGHLKIEKLEFCQYLCISQQALVQQSRKARSNRYFYIWPLDLWPMWPLGHGFSKGYNFKTVILRLWLLLKLNRKSWVAGLLPPLAWPSDDRSGQNDVQSKSSIFLGAVTRKRMQIGPRLLLMSNRKSWVAGLESPLAWTSHDRKRSKWGPTEVKHISEGCNLETLADRAMVTIKVE